MFLGALTLVFVAKRSESVEIRLCAGIMEWVSVSLRDSAHGLQETWMTLDETAMEERGRIRSHLGELTKSPQR